MANKGYTTATDIADWIVKNTKSPFREAHHITGKIVLLAEKNKLLSELSLMELKSIEPKINEYIFNYLSIENSISKKKSYGGTEFNQIKAIKRAKKKI